MEQPVVVLELDSCYDIVGIWMSTKLRTKVRKGPSKI